MSETTSQLLERGKQGDEASFEVLFRRYLPRLHRWARGRLPLWARDLSETTDVVQETLYHTLNNIRTFQQRGEGDFLAYLRRGVINRIRHEMRRVGRRPVVTDADNELAYGGPSPLQEAIGRESSEAYRRALARLGEEERQAVVGRIELGMTYAQLAELLGRPSPDAVRMQVVRALITVAEEMQHVR